MKYYIDPFWGQDSNTGTDAKDPWRTLEGHTHALQPGDQVLFRRGTVMKKALVLPGGSELGPITYSAYGEGPDPVVNPSIDASSLDCWKELSPGIWQYTKEIPTEICNIVFDDGASFGNLRWSQEDLKNPGEWYYTRLGHSIHSEPSQWPMWGNGTLYVCCPQNPASVYASIELVCWGDRMAVTSGDYAVIEHVTFEKSGVHGFSREKGHHITIRNCCFRLIGGGVWDFKTRVRLGNGVEFWNGAHDCIVEHCVFEDIYDSGVTHQGYLGESEIPQRLYFRHNVFMRCGMACYEWRGPSSRDIYFEQNVCLQGGGAFTMQGEQPPRRTEIPFHPATSVYVLIWRLEETIPKDGTYCTIRGNVFYHAPRAGAAISSGIDPGAMEQFVFENNLYCQPDSDCLIHWKDRDYRTSQFAAYQEQTHADQNSLAVRPEYFRPPYEG
ncbi:MAG TPA: right-handed parallel beta-helix repeat-containing protein [Candidatus Fimimorpha excrementavium]|nr:right-handed parallel beta-helix repeat-containing protein [Candidatus Fimimorpha excrementavium]